MRPVPREAPFGSLSLPRVSATAVSHAWNPEFRSYSVPLGGEREGLSCGLAVTIRSRVAREGTGPLDGPETCSQAKLRPPVSSSLSRADSIRDAHVERSHRAGIRGGDRDPRQGAATARPGGQRLCPRGKRAGGPGEPLTVPACPSGVVGTCRAGVMEAAQPGGSRSCDFPGRPSGCPRGS